jgi:ribosomal protein L15
LFFEFKVIYAYRWRKYGEEKIIIENNQLTLIKTIGKRGVTQVYSLNEIKKIDFFKNDGVSFIKSMNTSYWNINKYHLALHLQNSVIPFAIDVDNKDAKKIINELLKFQK